MPPSRSWSDFFAVIVSLPPVASATTAISGPDPSAHHGRFLRGGAHVLTTAAMADSDGVHMTQTEIGARLGAPLESVKTRARPGLEQPRDVPRGMGGPS
jgi:hypothetical protein